jgi:predicted nuclease with TOPRIM domain
LKLQLAQINDIFLKFTDTTKSELESIRQSQEFLSTKFDELAVSTNQLKNENKELRTANTQLQNRAASLEKQHISLDTETENMKRYLRRDWLEIHGVPESSTESTNKLVVQVASLIVPELNLNEADISTSHRLPTNKEIFKPFIAKFVRRDTPDAI